jgi:four helix bundle protein
MFDALNVALVLVSLLRKVLAQILLKDPDLARQIRKAASSIPLNLAEGRERAGRDRVHHYRIAFGSAAELAAALAVAEAWGYAEVEDLEEARAAIDRVRAMLWRLTR